MILRITGRRSNVRRRFASAMTAGLLLGMLCGCTRQAGTVSVSAETITLEQTQAESSETLLIQETVETRIYVYVCGCVVNPGVYVLDGDARIYEAVEAAGGMTEDAYSSAVNLAQKLEDQMQIYIPSQDEVSEGLYASDADCTDAQTADDRININTATADELTQLPGIGEAKAADIVNYREENGDFTDIEELMNVSGIKEGIFEKIRDLITVD